MRRPLVASFVAVLLVGACTGSKGPPDLLKEPAAAIRAAPGRARAARTAAVATSFSLALGGSTVSIRGKGAMDFARQLAGFTVDYGPLFTFFKAPKGTEAEFEFLFVPGALYLRLPPGERDLLRKPWARIDTAKLSGPAGGNPFAGIGSSDPSSSLDLLGGAEGTPTRAGTETIGEIKTFIFQVEIDLDRAIAASPKDARAALREAFRDRRSIAAKVWLGADGLPRRVRLEFDGPTGTSTFTTEFSEYGKTVSLQIPSSSETVVLKDASEFSQIFARLLTGGKNPRPISR